MSAPLTHRGWRMDYDPAPIPVREFDWTATHPDYDGPGDDRTVHAATQKDLMFEIDAWHMDNLRRFEVEHEPVRRKRGKQVQPNISFIVEATSEAEAKATASNMLRWDAQPSDYRLIACREVPA